MSHAKLEITKRKHEEQVWNVLEMHLMMESRSWWDKSENKNTTKATATCVSKHRGEVLEIEKVEPRKPDQILHIFTELK